MTSEHKRQFSFLAEQSPPVLQDFCKLATDYLQKGPNPKIYGAAALKLSVEPEFIRSCVESLINLLLESDKRRLTVEGFERSTTDLGFDDETGPLLWKLYEAKRPEITQALSNIGLKVPQYHNVEWRFQTEIASRCLFGRLNPVFAIDLTVVNHKSSNDAVQHFLMQIDPKNLLHLTRELEFAMQEARGQHTRKIKKSIKL